ncbi:hypothetical protein DQ354_18925 [Arthrobacter sp. AQ5-06]|nr:hypothetical protein DQ354_18925 [Arthrobacter sp. AQ5-06]
MRGRRPRPQPEQRPFARGPTPDGHRVGPSSLPAAGSAARGLRQPTDHREIDHRARGGNRSSPASAPFAVYPACCPSCLSGSSCRRRSQLC